MKENCIKAEESNLNSEALLKKKLESRLKQTEKEKGEIKNVCNAKIGSKPIKANIIDPVITVRNTAITGTRKFITVDGLPLALSSGIKLTNSLPSH